MDKVNINIPDYKDTIFSIKEIMTDHHISIDQTFHLLCKVYNVEDHIITPNEQNELFTKGLLKAKGQVNQTLLFHLKTGQQLELDLGFESKPIGDDFTLDIADRIEKQFTNDKLLNDDYRKSISMKYFKGDLAVARYYLIFRSLFPVKSTKTNKKWNDKFGFIYEGIDLWDDSLRVAKKFYEVYTKYDIGIFLETVYTRVKNSIDFESEKVFMTKPYKFLNNFRSTYEEVEENVLIRMTNVEDKIKPDINKEDELYV